MQRFLHFDLILKICQLLKSWLLLRNKINVYNLVLYKRTYSRCMCMCIFIRLKRLLNFMANIGRNCTFVSMFVYFPSHQSLSFFPRFFFKWPEFYILILYYSIKSANATLNDNFFCIIRGWDVAFGLFH